jgi:hypothetical protein
MAARRLLGSHGMIDRMAAVGRLLSTLVLLSGCAVALEPLQASERTDTSSANPSASAGAGSAGSEAGANGGGAGASGAQAGASGGGGAEADAANDSSPNAPPDGGLCPTTTDYILKYFDALKDGGVLAPCTPSSCAPDECCWKYKSCIGL